MQVTNNQPTTTNHPTGQAAGAGFDIAARQNDQVNQMPQQELRQAQATAAVRQIFHTMSAHGAEPQVAALAQQALQDAVGPMLANPGVHFDANLEILAAHIVHGLLARAGVIDDPNVPPTGPFNIPQHRDDGTLEIVLIALPDVPEEAPVSPEDNLGRSNDTALRIHVENYRVRRLQDIRNTMEFTHGARHLSAAASRTFFEAAREIVQNPHEFTIENMKIMQAHIIHHLLARDGIIDDPNAPTEGPIPVPQYLADGTLHNVPVELLMERPQRDNA